MKVDELVRCAGFWLVGVSLILGIPAIGATTSNSQKTQVQMDKIFAALTSVLPLSLNGEEYEKPANRKRIEQSLKSLSDEAAKLQAHAAGQDRTFAFISSSLAKDAQDIYRWYSRGSYGESRYLLHNLTENCIACHSRLPSGKMFPAAAGFFKDINISSLPLVEQAQLQMATRQFDAAMKSYESIFKSPEIHTSEIIMMDGFVDYLKLSIRVKKDLKRPVPVLGGMLKRADLPRFVSLQISQWIRSLDRLAKVSVKSGSELTVARGIISRAQKSSEYPMDRSQLVDFIFASRLLNTYVQEKDVPGKKSRLDLAEAYYLLGLTESLIGRSYWLSQTDFYLETAVRSAPKSRFAEKAYALLEEQVLVEYSGSGGTDIPADMQKTLDELWGLMKR